MSIPVDIFSMDLRNLVQAEFSESGLSMEFFDNNYNYLGVSRFDGSGKG